MSWMAAGLGYTRRAYALNTYYVLRRANTVVCANMSWRHSRARRRGDNDQTDDEEEQEDDGKINGSSRPTLLVARS